MYESISVVGERGQITIPKAIREKEGLKKKDKVIVKIEDSRIVVEKAFGRQEKEKAMAEGYRRTAERSLAIAEDMKHASSEA